MTSEQTADLAIRFDDTANMAYLMNIWPGCDSLNCKVRAVVTLYSWQNVKLGQFCKRHGEAQLQIERDDEARAAGGGR